MTTSTTTHTLIEPPSPSRLHSSISSLSSSRQQRPSVVRIYKQASSLFLTRRIREALDVLEPTLRRPTIDNDNDADGATESAHAPVASASKGVRVKVWSLYVSIINEIISMGAGDAKHAFGSLRWKHLVAKAREGTIWEEVVHEGYHGVEGNVDADVVANLATLLLAHAPSQKLTQQRLETYLSASSSPFLDIAAPATQSQETNGSSRSNATSPPRELNSRLKILEIFILHVLPRNEEWNYARDFINLSEVLDDERKEAYSEALRSLEEAHSADFRKEQELQKQREQQLEASRRREREEEERKMQERRLQEEDRKKKQEATTKPSEHDYGVDQSKISDSPKSSGKPAARQAPITGPNSHKASSSVKTTTQPSKSSIPAKKPRVPPPSLYKRATLSLASIRLMLTQMGQTLSKNPMLLFRMVLFFVALLMALARRDVRNRIRQMTDSSWDKIKGTIGMGVKVSYI